MASISVETNAFSMSTECCCIPLIYVYVIKMYRTIILPVVLYGCETWSLTLREECRLRVFENKLLTRTFGPKGDDVTGNGKNYIMRGLIFCTAHPVLFG